MSVNSKELAGKGKVLFQSQLSPPIDSEMVHMRVVMILQRMFALAWRTSAAW